MNRAYYSDSIADFLDKGATEILGTLARGGSFSLESTQRDAWLEQIEIMRVALSRFRGRGAVFFEYAVPRLGKRIDVIALVGPVAFVLEFKVGEREFAAHAIDQVWDYALDLKNFHQTSHALPIAPVLVATKAAGVSVPDAEYPRHDDALFLPIKSNADALPDVFDRVLASAGGPDVDVAAWAAGRYCPTPTIIEAATALYGGHAVAEISRSDATATNLSDTSQAISQIIRDAKANSRKVICFVTGVPGAGKTLVGLNIATQHIKKEEALYSVFLSGNGPLVAILREALARDKVRSERDRGRKVTKSSATSEVKTFIQNVHHFRDECLVDVSQPPVEHVALFDEAQRAWNTDQTSSFMRRKKGRANFTQSEPEFLMSCLDRHDDWAVIVCLVGGGQEINTGEAGISEWVESVLRSYRGWHVYLSSRLSDTEYGTGRVLQRLESHPHVVIRDELHLAVSMRSFRAEHVSRLVKQLLDLDVEAAQRTFAEVRERFPLVITRDVGVAKAWLKERARGTERCGLIASSQAQRLKPHGIDVKSPIDPIHWFLDGKDDVRSSYFLEDVATEFHVQGLELDWACVAWDADFRHAHGGWEHWSFCGSRWNRIKQPERQLYQKNAYRVLLTRARQGMIILVPPGDASDPTRPPAYYGSTYALLGRIGFAEV